MKLEFAPARPNPGNCRDGWIKQPKGDGVRCIAISNGRYCQFFTRTGERIRRTEKLPRGVWDGELINGTYYAFDCIKFGSKMLSCTPLEERLLYVRAHMPHIIEEVPPDKIEGYVYKNPKSLYPYGKTNEWLKERFR